MPISGSIASRQRHAAALGAKVIRSAAIRTVVIRSVANRTAVISSVAIRTAVISSAVISSAVCSGPDHGAAATLAAAASARPSPSVSAPRLDWRPCARGSHFDCATAKVPLDYRHPGSRTIELAVIKRKATGPGRRIGTLFFNPGGPGGPGTVQMPGLYEHFPRQVRERFDIVSWDPRGIGYSTAVNCFSTPKEAETWLTSKPAGFPVGERQRTIWNAAYRDLARRCQQRAPELLRHVSTADTAQDLDQLRQAVGEPQLSYFGISYGSFLGATYANLFPGRVRAMVIDSNVDPQAWTNHASPYEPRLPLFLRMGADLGAAATRDQFLASCGSSTTAHCAFSAGGPKATRNKFDQLMRRLRAHPQGAWTYARTVADTVTALYTVHPVWTDLAGRLQTLWQGDVPKPAPSPPSPSPVKTPYMGEEQAAAVLCSDSPNPRDLAAYPAAEAASSARAGDAGRFWTWAAEPCAFWPVKAVNRYTGPWNNRTAHPVLVVNTTYDPATPYRGAQAMAKELANARLLTLHGYGHTALGNPSRCVKEYEGRYFIDGVLPPAGTTCQQDTPPFRATKPRGGVATGGGAMADIAPRA